MFTHAQNKLLTPIEYLKGVGPARAALLRSELNIQVFQDMLNFFPYRYIDRRQIISIKQIQHDGAMVQLIGRIEFSETVGTGRSRRLVAQFRDATGSIELLWFQGISFFEKQTAQGGDFMIFGKASLYNGHWSITHPEMERLENRSLDQLPSYQAVYSSTEKLRYNSLAGRAYNRLVLQLLSQLREVDIPEILPVSILQRNQLQTKWKALQDIHTPQQAEDLDRAIHRLKFEELFLHQIGICKLKLNNQKEPGYTFSKVGDLFNQFYHQHLPFELTEDQKQVLREIRTNTQTGFQMNRLLQGDVGSGKTIVALLSMLLAIDNGFQACLMAPTEILAQQHKESIQLLVAELPVRVGFLSGKSKAKEKRTTLQLLRDGELDILIGTHALIEDTVVFKNLGLCIIDEQHRFGVAQRAQLWSKNTRHPHMLVMTATPIPRTLAMTAYGDLDVSVIKNLPPGRKPISTIHRTDIHRARVMDFIKQEISSGRQAYIVYPLIEESEKLTFENLQAGYEQVKQFFPDHTYRIAMVHGKQPAAEREQNMNAFVKGAAHIMVATTVIEVGVNVPNASVMLIESAERFGLSQLHQLRGRVGRGADKSYCILLTTNKLTMQGKERMHTMVQESSGFVIAEKDLALRGPGEIEGTRQSGVADLKLADIIQDGHILETSRQECLLLLQEDPALNLPAHQNLKQHLLSRKDKEIWSKIS
jgi:ATP-dependent DNA helicase RecG